MKTILFVAALSIVSAQAAVSIRPGSGVAPGDAPQLSSIVMPVFCKDAQGDLFVAGEVSAKQPNGTALRSALQVVKVNGITLQPVWAKNVFISQTWNTNIATKVVCKNGKVFVTGQFVEGPTPPLQGPSEMYDADIFLLKLNASNGAQLGLTRYKPINPEYPTSKLSDYPVGLEVDNQDNAYIAGDTGTTMIQGHHLGHSKWFITKINAKGVSEWTGLVAGPYVDADANYARNGVNSMTMSPDQSEIAVNGYVAMNDDVTAAQVVKFSTVDGTQKASMNFNLYGMINFTWGGGIAMDSQNNVFIGSRGGDYETQTAATFVTKLDANLGVTWIHEVPTAEGQSSGDFNFISLDADGDVAASGRITGVKLVSLRLNGQTGAQISRVDIANPAGTVLTISSQLLRANGNLDLVYTGKVVAANGYDVFAQRLTKAGAQAGSVLYNPAATYNDYAYGAVPAADDLILFSTSSKWLSPAAGMQITRQGFSNVGPSNLRLAH